MTDLLAAYDTQLRGEVETPSAVARTTLGPLCLARFDPGRGFITYRDLGGADEAEIGRLVAAATAHYRRDPEIRRVEWKTRGHDRAPGLERALTAAGYVAQETESIMIGPATALAVEATLPREVSLRRIETDAEVRAMCRMESEVFGDDEADAYAVALTRRLATGDGMELWVAEARGEIVSAGRLEPVPDTDFAGLWGGATLPAWRGRGIYRALTAARARSALTLGKTLINSDSTEFSRPILERAGLVRVSTTTPYELALG